MTTTTTALFPAFKEWTVIVEALGHGGQIAILRKGGIAEGRQGFQIKHDRFWLFPTQYHQQLDKTKAAAAAYAGKLQPEIKAISLQYFAEITDVRYLETEAQLTAVDDQHLWKNEIITERFNYGGETGLHLIVVRIHALPEPVVLQPDASYDGCKSWIEVPVDFTSKPTQPVLGDAEFQKRRSALLAKLA